MATFSFEDAFQPQPKGGGSFTFEEALGKKADPKIGQPEELSFAEKYVAPLLDKLGTAAQNAPVIGDAARTLLNDGNARGGAVGRLAMGAADPGVAIAQMGANAVGMGDPVNKRIQAVEQQYQDARKEAGSQGFDPLRLAGQVGMGAFMQAATPGVGFLDKAPVIKATAQGAAFGGLNPVVDGGDNFWTEKAKEVGLGAAGGAATSLLGSALARLVSPKASVNPDLQLLREEGVRPTIGQTLGGIPNRLEQKASSLPIVGDAIAKARARSFEDFDNAAINRAMTPIGEKVQGAGNAAIAEAQDKLSTAYKQALGNVNHVNFDTPEFNQALGQLTSMTQGLTSDMARKFDHTLKEVVLRKMSPNGSIAGADLKAVDSELGQIASRWGRSADASHQEFGDAVRQLQANLRDQVSRSEPIASIALRSADKGYANLVRAENAANRGVVQGGIFTPGQYLQAVRATDNTVRDRATAAGKALGQDLGAAGQNVLGNVIPNSGTMDRAGVAALIMNPHLAIPAGIAGAGLYTRPVQNLLAAAIAARPAGAPRVANQLRRLAALGPVATVPAVEAARDR